MSTIIVGDLHGKVEVAKEILEDRGQAIVFVGDYLDSFDRTIHDQITLLDMILDAVENRDNVEALYGNHELSYLIPSMRCSGWNNATQIAVHAPERIKRMAMLDYYTEVDGYLITHAGVSRTWLPSSISADNVHRYLNSCTRNRLYEIGYARGGYNRCGGPLWCDYWQEFEPVLGLKQVFGHTRFRPKDKIPGIWEDHGNYLIDCLDDKKEVLHIHNGITSYMEL